MSASHRVFLVAALVAALVCNSSAATDTDPASQVLLEINGFPVTTLHLALFASQTGRNPEQADEQIRMLNELANNFMIANSAQGKALEDNPEIAAALEVARARLIAQSFVRNAIAAAQPDETAIRKRYDETYATRGGTEYKARHILLNSRDAAVAAITELDKGADFAALASTHSIGPSKTVGGDLGWFEPEQMVAPFSSATAALADGSYSREPVKTQFGWHVILREQSRAVAAPEFDSVKAEIEDQIRQEQVTQVIKQIRDQAQIDVKSLGDSD